ncbi:MAG: UvrD-helicase domain-containing protein [Candidatus Dadabacteria bacterium]|nr:UvrD-helicase domain-containing protein [Candidatus Dadabacteria bacterium]
MHKHFYKNDMASNPKNDLNDSQQEAVKHPGGPLLVLAGAGSGKTRIITERISYLIKEHNVSPYNILAVTFTNKAANEMKKRVSRLAQNEAKNIWIGTFHSTCLRILKREINKLDGYSRDFIIYDDADQIKLIRDCMVRLNIGERLLSPKHVRSQIDSAKNNGFGPDSSELNHLDKNVLRIYSLYEQELRKSNALDFGDLLHVTVKLFEKNPEVLQNYQNKFQHILVDEYQDTNHVQYKIVELLSRKHRNIFVVGDDNQSIYGWRGADIKNILNFEKDYSDAQIIKLERNYRSTKTILEAANKLILQNKNRHDKNLWTKNATGDQINYYEARDDKDEAKHVCSQIGIETKNGGYSNKDIAIFFRTNTQSRLIEEELLHKGIPYKIVGGTEFYKRTEIKDILAFLKVIANPSNEISLKRIINVPPRGIGKVTVNKLDEIAREKEISFFEAIKLALEKKLLSNSVIIKVERLYNLLTQLIEFSEKDDIVSLINYVLYKTKYLDMLEREEERRENIGEILNLAAEFEKERDHATLNDFLDSVSLASDLDNLIENSDQVTLMTLHSAKGLEFPVVFIVGMEENLLPHFNSTMNGQVEEERRLFYVGITRAKEKLYLAGATKRMIFGKQQWSIPSRFISELPKELIKWENFEYGLMTETGSSKKSSTKPISKTRKTYENSGRYKVGQKVAHSSFGEGLIKKVEGSGDEAKVTVFFPGYGLKKIIASYLE